MHSWQATHAIELFSCLVALLVAASPVESAQAPPFPPSPRPDAKWLALHQSYVEEARKLQGSDLEVLMYGDSITEFARGSVRGKRCCADYHAVWRHVIAERFASTIFAISADQTPHLLWRILNGELGGLQPRVAVILIGTNDIGYAARCQYKCSAWWSKCSPKQDSADMALAAERAAATIEQMVAHLLQATSATQVLLQAVLPRGFHGPDLPNIFSAPIALLNQRLQQLAASRRRVHYVDCGTDFIAPDGRALVKAFLPDFLHPSPAGGVFMYQCIARAVEDLLRPDATPSS